jgi:hypothetical protein
MINFKANKCKKNKSKKIGVLGIIFLFCATSFLNNSLCANASSQSILNISKGGTNANSVENAQKNLGKVDFVDNTSSDSKFPSSKAVYDYINEALKEYTFVLATNNELYYSSDGITWQLTKQFTSQDMYTPSVAYGGGKFVVSGGRNDSPMTTVTSEDGINWSELKTINNISCQTNLICGITWGDGKFVNLGNEGKITYSTNGENWVEPFQAGQENFYGITYGADKFVAITKDSFIYSSSGEQGTWSTAQKISPQACDRNCTIKYLNGLFLWGLPNGYITTSTDGINWSEPKQIPSITGSISAFAYSKKLNKYILAQYSDGNGNYAYSSDGINWTAGDYIIRWALGLLWAKDKFIGAGSDQNTFYSNNDATEWTTNKINASGQFYGLASNHN